MIKILKDYKLKDRLGYDYRLTLVEMGEKQYTIQSGRRPSVGRFVLTVTLHREEKVLLNEEYLTEAGARIAHLDLLKNFEKIFKGKNLEYPEDNE